MQFQKTKTAFLMAFPLLFFATFPTSNNYQLRDFGFGAGGTEKSSSSNYDMEGIVGQNEAINLSGANFDLAGGLQSVQQSHLPSILEFKNDGDNYDKLFFLLNPANNPSDSKFALAISKDHFITTQFVQNDYTVGDILGVEDYQSYVDWGGSSGAEIIGLEAGQIYQLKVKAKQGNFTETAFGPEKSAATGQPSLVFDLDISSLDEETSPVFWMDFDDLWPDITMEGPKKIWVDFETNANLGGRVYASSENLGLKSNHSLHTISSITGNLDNLTEGFGMQGINITQTDGGPFFIANPFNNVGNFVGEIGATPTEIFGTNNPIKGGRGSLVVKAKISSTTPSSDDYEENLTFIASSLH